MPKIFVRFGKAGRELYGLAEVMLGLGDLMALQQNRPEQGHHVDVIGIAPDRGSANGFRFVGPTGIDQCDGFAQRAL